MSDNYAQGALICGSVAYDTILLFEDRFKAHILPDKLHILNVAFYVPQMRREFGGCAANIAYGLKLLGERGVPMATVGEDFAPYRDRMASLGVPLEHVKPIAGTFTAQAFITTDLDDNQITAFHPGAMQQSHVNKIGDAQGIGLGIISPDGSTGMLEHAAQFAAAKIPFMFDPGQQLPVFDAEQLKKFISLARWVTVNDYEWELLQQKTGLSAADITAQVEALVVTRGAEGSVIHTRQGSLTIPCVKSSTVVDPTGCGDAYRAGLIHGLMRGMNWEAIGRTASLMGAIKIESLGPQNYRFTRAQFEQRYRDAFG
jgi:adenosine kinase